MLFQWVRVFIKLVTFIENALKPITLFLFLMNLHMLLEISITRESLLTNFTHKWTVTGMDPVMAHQVWFLSECFLASFYFAGKRSLLIVNSFVFIKSWKLGEDLVAFLTNEAIAVVVSSFMLMESLFTIEYVFATV